MPTLGQAITRVKDGINRGSEYDTWIQAALIDAIQFFRARRFTFNTKRQSFVASAEYTSLSADFIEVDYVVLTTGTRRKKLTPMNAELMAERHTDLSSSAEPNYFSIVGTELRLYPSPDDSYSLEIFGLTDLHDISYSTSHSATSNAWFTDGYDLVTLHATIDVLETKVNGPEAYEDAARLRLRETQALGELTRRANKAHATGQITPCF